MTVTIQDQLVSYLTDAHALEQHVDAVLASALRMTDVPELRGPLEHHKQETERHKRLLEERLAAHDASPSKVKDAGMALGALALGIFQRVRSDSVGKLARDAMLERVADRAGDKETADVARRNKADEQAMAAKIAALWDLAVDLSLKAEGVEGTPPIPSPKGTAM
jgi:ferritin-like metal-binding protein YciE